MSMYDDLFGQFEQPVAQILLTRNDLADVSYSNAIFLRIAQFYPYYYSVVNT